ncbi:DNA repair protein RecO [Leptospira sp. GIMC2001]|uniref:DNA repair protein RecO n=1 Tax=Leptospira sp. GIMC2001 TaxID=1513297 RepID=UPI002349F0C7|nr:DNA repair protein RecO [Leptospira sp. GIMC2001]WCL48306.1 DNA repair protein RecO [Leptospira sp. GIMC2001]
MALKKDKGLVIAVQNIGEKDRILSVLGESEPRQKYFLRGIRNSKTRPMLAAEIGSYIELNYYDREGKDWKDVKEVFLVERFDEIKSSVLGLYFISYLCEMVSFLLLEGENHAKEAKLLFMAFSEVEKNGFHFGILPFLKVRILGYLGLLPEEFQCCDCGEDLWSKKSADYIDSSFEMFCGDCRSLQSNRIDVIRFFRDCNRIRFSELFKEPIPYSLLKELDISLNHFLDQYLGRTLKTSAEFYKLLNDELRN